MRQRRNTRNRYELNSLDAVDSDFCAYVFKYFDKRYKVKGNIIICTDNVPNQHIVGVFGDDANNLFRYWCQTVHENYYITYDCPSDYLDDGEGLWDDFWGNNGRKEDDYDEEDLREQYGFND